MKRHQALALLIPLTLIILLSGCSPMLETVDFNQLQLPDSPNWYLICPPMQCREANAEAPVFNLPVEALDDKWQRVISETKRVEPFYSNTEDRHYAYVIRTKWLRFPDTVNVQLYSLGENASSIAIYSRSKYGYSDLGVNQARVEKFLAQLQS